MDEPTDAEIEAAVDARWWETHDNVVSVAYYMAEHGYSAKGVAVMVEKPWKYTDVYLLWHAEWQEEVNDA